LMEEKIILFQVSKGSVVPGSFRHEEDETVYIWMRRFESEEDRVRLYAAVYESDFWKNEISPQVPTLMDRSGIVVKRILPTPLSTTQ
ncbi:MAG: NIPSNAP family containing protein, partial [Proteobacteria bacterium]|nr:NIPSNAP family containing protein [Pseudomonadota bacterium]